MLGNLFHHFKKYGLKETLREYGKEFLGIHKQQVEIDTMYYFLNQFLDVNSLPPADGVLRKLQLCDIELLKIFDEMCKENQLIYWLDFGTLLGAVRHKGFIPWDDDLDVCMPREDYEKAKGIFPGLFEELGFQYYVNFQNSAETMGIGFRGGVWLDVYPIDEIMLSSDKDDEIENKLSSMVNKMHTYCSNHTFRHEEEFDLRNKYIISDDSGRKIIYCYDPRKDVIVHRRWYNKDCKVSLFRWYHVDEIFPLEIGLFEGIDVPIPSDSSRYLQSLYGDDWKKLPHKGIFKHGTEKAAETYDVDATLIDLKSIFSRIKYYE